MANNIYLFVFLAFSIISNILLAKGIKYRLEIVKDFEILLPFEQLRKEMDKFDKD